MLTAPQIITYVKAVPFRPFQLRMASGNLFEIRHPEMIKVGKSFVLVFSLSPDHPEVVETWETVSLMLIESISHSDLAVGA